MTIPVDMGQRSSRQRASGRVATLLALGLGSALGASAQPRASTDPFITDAVVGVNARSYEMDVEDKEQQAQLAHAKRSRDVRA